MKKIWLINFCSKNYAKIVPKTLEVFFLCNKIFFKNILVKISEIKSVKLQKKKNICQKTSTNNYAKQFRTKKMSFKFIKQKKLVQKTQKNIFPKKVMQK